MKQLLIVLMLVGMTGMVYAAECPEEVRMAVLRKLNFPSIKAADIHFSRNYSENHWKPILDAQQEKINRTRKWSKTIKDICIRKEYTGWMDYYQYELNEAWKELREKPWEKDMEKYNREREIRWGKILQYERKTVVPSPPQ